MDLGLKDQVVVVSGGSRGIGRAIARSFAREGAKVCVVARGEGALAKVVAELEGDGASAAASEVADVTRPDEAARVIDAVIARWGAIDVLVNNAGLGGTADIVDMTDEQWSAVLDVTLTGTFRCTRAALRHMIPRGRGVVVNNASVVGWRAQEGQAHYAAAKAGVMALTRVAAAEAAKAGVRVNAVAPSLAMHPHLAKVTTEELLGELARREAFGRAAEPWEVANVIVFLASDYSSYMTGEVVSVSSQHP
jgi:3-oxoacyl-[acyl-carrier protein] reductase